jgi:hypothetical protein
MSVYIPTGMRFNLKRSNIHLPICNNMAEPGGHYFKLNKPGPGRSTQRDLTCM